MSIARFSLHPYDPSAASAYLSVPAGRAPQIVLDRLQACLRAIFVRASSIHGHLDAFAANAGEKCGLGGWCFSGILDPNPGGIDLENPQEYREYSADFAGAKGAKSGRYWGAQLFFHKLFVRGPMPRPFF